MDVALVQRGSTLDNTKKLKDDVHGADVAFGKAVAKATKAVRAKTHPLPAA